jgi:heavy metal translocating P-type ATPase
MEGAVTVQALHSAADSQYEQIIKLVRSAAASQSPFVRLADRYAIPFTLVSFIVAGAAWFVSGDPRRFLEVLVVATPCPLLLGAPIALISGMSRAAKHGIIVKTGSALERLAEVETVAFDKTGTLTRGKPLVSSITTFGKFTKNDVLMYAAVLEQASNHVLAQAIIEAAARRKIKLPKARQVNELSGLCLTGRHDGKSVLVGRLSLFREEGIDLPPAFKEKSVKDTATYVAVNGQFAGVITFNDEIRPESKAMLGRLRAAGIKHIVMITGDNAQTAQSVAKELGITDVKADCLPADKLLALDAIEHRPVAFVGDGVNDAPVLTASDVGIALGARGSTAASESADVVILQDDVSKVAQGVDIAQRTFFIARQSILIGIFISLGLMAVFSTGKFKAVHGAAIQEVVDIIVIVNALRAHGSFRKGSKTV